MAEKFAVWAPRPSRVELLVSGERLAMDADEDGWWRRSADAPTGTSYAFCLDGGDPRPDPRGLRLPDGPQGRSEVYLPGGFTWTDAGWAGVPLEGAVIYETHVGTFTTEGTLDAAIGRLDHLVDLGVTLVELMPLAPFPGCNGWGYDGVAPYAVHEPYGGPVALQRFVDAAHARGLGVCLDVVYNHLGPDGNYLQEFGPYLTERYRTPWGPALNLDGPDCEPVRRWVLDNVRQWLDDFHIDALRLDAVHELHDQRPVHILEEMSAEVDALATRENRMLWLIAESDRNDPGTVSTRGKAGGLGIHAQWADDVHHALHVALTGETDGYYSDFASPGALAKVLGTPFFHDGTWSSFRERPHGRPVDPALVSGWRFVASLQTHDQVGNRAMGDRLSMNVSPGLLACGAALLLTSPWTPMLFMGEEWGARTPWQYFTDHTDPDLAEGVRQGRRAEFAGHGWDRSDVPDPQAPQTVETSRLDWSEPTREPHLRLLGWYRDLIALRRARPDLGDARLGRDRVRHDHDAGTVLVARGRHRVAVNLSAQTRTVVLDMVATVLMAWDVEAPVAPDGKLTLPPHSAAVLGPG